MTGKEIYAKPSILSFSFWLLDTCTCSTPGAGTKNKNQFICSNDETRYCASDQECYATDAFVYGQWKDGCRIPGTFEGSRNLPPGVNIIIYDIHYTNHQLFFIKIDTECQPRFRTKECSKIRVRETCLTSEDPGYDPPEPCGWCGSDCGNDNVCEPLKHLKENDITYEICLYSGTQKTINELFCQKNK